MWDDGERAFRSFATARSVGLRRQAYLLTGDRSSAEFLAERALLAAHLQYRQFGSAGVDEFARAELVRSFVADAYTDWRPRSAATLGPDRRPGGAFRGRAAVWEALRSLPPRRPPVGTAAEQRRRRRRGRHAHPAHRAGRQHRAGGAAAGGAGRGRLPLGGVV